MNLAYNHEGGRRTPCRGSRNIHHHTLAFVDFTPRSVSIMEMFVFRVQYEKVSSINCKILEYIVKFIIGIIIYEVVT